MNSVNFADSGEKVSEMCLGTMMFGDRCDEAESARILDTAVKEEAGAAYPAWRQSFKILTDT